MNNNLILVNKEHMLADDYVPLSLTKIDVQFVDCNPITKCYMNSLAAKNLKLMFLSALNSNILFKGVSAYRPYRRQKEIFEQSILNNGYKHAIKYSALPGNSEHQTGLAVDISSAEVNYELIPEFSSTYAYEWLTKNCMRFGFIIRYPKGKEDITGYAFEPWHLRYVGKNTAYELTKRNLVLEDYIKH